MASLSGVHELTERLRSALPEVTLASQVRPGPLPARVVIALVRRVAEQLEPVHRRRLCHGALRPDVILVRGDQVRVTGWGLDGVAGGPWAAPELLRGEPPDPRSDVYALGAIASHALAPNQERDLLAAPIHLITLLECMLARDPARRPAIAKVRAAALHLEQTSASHDDPTAVDLYAAPDE